MKFSKKSETPAAEKPKKKRKKGRIFLIVLLVLIVGFVALMMSGDDIASTTGNTTTTESTSEKQPVTYKDDNMKIEYSDIEKYDGIEGCFYLSLKVKNKTDETVTVALKDVSINGNSMQTGTGVPIVINSDESSSQPFVIFQSGTDIDSVDDIENIKFRVVFYDESYNEYKVSERISVDLK